MTLQELTSLSPKRIIFTGSVKRSSVEHRQVAKGIKPNNKIMNLYIKSPLGIAQSQCKEVKGSQEDKKLVYFS